MEGPSPEVRGKLSARGSGDFSHWGQRSLGGFRAVGRWVLLWKCQVESRDFLNVP